LPIIRFSKAFGIARAAKVFLNLEGGITRGAKVPQSDSERARALKKRLREARTLVREQRTTLKSKDREIRELEENLKTARRRNFAHKRDRYRQRLEIFRLNNELATTRGPIKSAGDGPPAPRASGAPEVGKLPDFVVIGAQKCGTTFFYSLLTGHPNVDQAAVKEVHYFDKQKNFSKGIEWYRRCFPTPTREDGRRSITGEASPSYLISRHAPERLASAVPDARLIVLLRNPVDRAYSHYHMVVARGHERRSFEEAIEEAKACAYLRRGIYVDQLLRWREFFGDEQLLVLKSEDLFKRTQDSLKLVLGYLDLPRWEPDLPPRKPKHRYDPMDPATRRRLEEFFEPHNRRLYELLGRDFGW
jgi:hypothetical protein